jgi:DNA (cytosine-5)-methyltransferase 1
MTQPIPVVDLFAGPGGLGEGFSSVRSPITGEPTFKIGVSVEKEEWASRTLRLRAFYRQFPYGKVPDAYYDVMQGFLTVTALFEQRQFQYEAEAAKNEAVKKELGVEADDQIDALIERAISGRSDWVLIGGPPCQAYSLAGRSRMRGRPENERDQDPRHTLYRQYLRIIAKYEPAVFVMENVKGILSAQHEGGRIFDRILRDLSEPNPRVQYEIRSFLIPRSGTVCEPREFVIPAELYGVPQSRHRVILLGVRADRGHIEHRALRKSTDRSTVESVIGGLPKIRSRLSGRSKAQWGVDSPENWLAALSGIHGALKGWRHPLRQGVVDRVGRALTLAKWHRSAGDVFVRKPPQPIAIPSLARWIERDRRIDGVAQHDARKHMAGDLHRYMFVSTFSQEVGRVPKLSDLPVRLLPEHENIHADNPPHVDRFKVQVLNQPGSTITSHISKDGHYFVHPDPTQCRSFTVREAARIQTFPDDYFFLGNRTEQYV